jgi:hypothetical protein
MTLSREHAEAIREPIRRQLAYLGRLRTRLTKRGFTPTDALYQRVEAAWNATQALSVEVHYMACAPETVGREEG